MGLCTLFLNGFVFQRLRNLERGCKPLLYYQDPPETNPQYLPTVPLFFPRNNFRPPNSILILRQSILPPFHPLNSQSRNWKTGLHHPPFNNIKIKQPPFNDSNGDFFLISYPSIIPIVIFKTVPGHRSAFNNNNGGVLQGIADIATILCKR